MIGADLYKVLKRNNLIVWGVLISGIIVNGIILIWAFSMVKQSQQNLFAINDKGILIPLVKLDEKQDRLKQVKANLAYFTDCYYDLDSYTMKEKKEKVLWLVGKKPTAIIKDRDKKGYFNNFLTINGLVQHASINEKSWVFNSVDSPYSVSFSLTIQLINGEKKNYYNCDVSATLEETSKNYPFNPYGLIITNYSEKLTKIDDEAVRNNLNDNVTNNKQN